MNSRLEIHQWDSDDVRTAKRHLNGDITIGGAELRRILLAVIDDREQWVAKAAIARDVMLGRLTQHDMHAESERTLMAAMSTQVREISAMLSTSNSQTRTLDELNEATPNLLRRQAE